jgi:hypothetical protein
MSLLGLLGLLGLLEVFRLQTVYCFYTRQQVSSVTIRELCPWPPLRKRLRLYLRAVPNIV